MTVLIDVIVETWFSPDKSGPYLALPGEILTRRVELQKRGDRLKV